MSDIAALVADHLDIWTSAIERKNSSGRGSSRKVSLYGIGRLRALILELALRGKLVPQDPTDEPAAMLLPKMSEEREKRVNAKEIKKTKLPVSVAEEPFVLPPDWKWIPMGQTGNIFTGNSVNSKVRSELESNTTGRPFVATKDIGYGLDPIAYENGLLTAEDDERFVVSKPSTVFICAEGGSAGRKIAISDREITFGNKLIANETWSSVESRFVLFVYLSDYFFDQFAEQMTGIIGGISRAKFLALPFPLAPLEEQRRIVAKVDELMALCDALERESENALAAHQTLVETLLATLVNSTDAADLAKNWARLEKHFDTLFTTESSIDALKQTILDLAVRGKLVEQELGDESADAFLEDISSQKQSLLRSGLLKKGREIDPVRLDDAPYTIPMKWTWSRLGLCANLVTDGEHLTPPRIDDPTAIPLVTAKNVRAGKMDYTVTDFVSMETAEKSWQRCQPELNDILLVSVGATIGRHTIVRDFRPMVIVRSVTLIKADHRLIPYLSCLIGSQMMQSQIWGGVKQSAQPCLYLNVSNALLVPLPPLAEQKRIVAKVDELMALCEQLKSRLANAAEAQRHLANAITEKAII